MPVGPVCPDAGQAPPVQMPVRPRRSRCRSQRRLYRLRPGLLRELDAWLAPYRAAWSASLDKLEAHLNDMDDDDRRAR